MTLTSARDILDAIDTCPDHDTTAGACDVCGYFLSQIDEANRIVNLHARTVRVTNVCRGCGLLWSACRCCLIHGTTNGECDGK